MYQKYYQGKTALITGGSSGIGFALADALSETGTDLILLARGYENLKNAQTALQKKHPNAKIEILSADVSDGDSLTMIYEEFLQNHETPDFLFNCAGVARPGYVEELPLSVFTWTMDIDYHGTVNMVKLLLPGMLKRGSGHIVNVSSIAGVVGLFGYTAYCGAKFAVRGFSDALRAEMKPKGIKVSVLYPPDTDTPQLTWENQYKPAETKIISGASKPLSPEFVASSTLKAAARGKYAIVPGFEAKLMYFASTRLGDWIYPIMDLMVRSASKKKSTS